MNNAEPNIHNGLKVSHVHKLDALDPHTIGQISEPELSSNLWTSSCRGPPNEMDRSLDVTFWTQAFYLMRSKRFHLFWVTKSLEYDTPNMIWYELQSFIGRQMVTKLKKKKKKKKKKADRNKNKPTFIWCHKVLVNFFKNVKFLVRVNGYKFVFEVKIGTPLPKERKAIVSVFWFTRQEFIYQFLSVSSIYKWLSVLFDYRTKQ